MTYVPPEAGPSRYGPDTIHKAPCSTVDPEFNIFFCLYRNWLRYARIPWHHGDSCRGTSPIRNRPTPQDPFRTLGIDLQKGPRGTRFLVTEAPL